MGVIRKYQSKYVHIDLKHPDGTGICDYTGNMLNRKDLQKQMEWRGNALVWTGMMVGTPFLDEPSVQMRPPPIKSDPKPIHDPRPPFPYFDPESNPVPSTPDLLNELEEDSFYNAPISLGTPNVVPGWPEDFQTPPYQILLKDLNKVRFQQ